MNFFRRFFYGATDPVKLFPFRKDRFFPVFLHVLILTLLATAPFIAFRVTTPPLPYEAELAIKRRLNTHAPLEFKITGGVLTATGGAAEAYFSVPDYNLLVAVVPAAESPAFRLYSPETRIILTEHGVRLTTGFINRELFRYRDYPELAELDLTPATNVASHAFWQLVFRVARREARKNFAPAFLQDFALQFLATAARYLLLAGVAVLILTTTTHHLLVRKEFFKLALYALTPYVAGTILSHLYGTLIFSLIGFVIALYYVRKLHGLLILNNVINQAEEEHVQ